MSVFTNTVTLHVPQVVEQLVHQLHISHGIFQIHLHISFAINCIICIWVFCSLSISLSCALSLSLFLYTHQVFNKISVSVRLASSFLICLPQQTATRSRRLFYYFPFVFLFVVVSVAAAKDEQLTLLWAVYMPNYTAQQSAGD